MKKNNIKKSWKKTHRQHKRDKMVTICLSLSFDMATKISKLAAMWGISKRKVPSRVLKEMVDNRLKEKRIIK